MKRKIYVIGMMILLSLLIAACSGKKKDSSISKDSSLVNYTQKEDGTWFCEGKTYQYKKELTGRDKNAEKDGRYVVLTNDSDITYEDVSWSFLSSQSTDALDPDETVVVEMGDKE